MGHAISTLIIFFLTAQLWAQVEIDQSILLTGATGQRSMQNLELPINGTDAVNKDYVDNAVSASGGGGATMVSDESPSSMSFGAAIRYCNALTEGSFTDWYLPYSEEMFQVLSRGGVIVSNNASASFLWTIGPVGDRSGNNPGTVQSGVTIRLSDGTAQGGVTQSTAYLVRCVR